MNIRPLPKELQLKALTELNEVPDRIEGDLKQIREWLEKQPHLHARSDDQWLLIFLRYTKFSIQRAKERLDNFYTTKTLVPEFCSDRDPLLPEIQDILKKGYLLPLTNKTDTVEPVIVLVRYTVVQSEKNSVLDLTKAAGMVLEVLLLENNTSSVAGIILLVDCEGYGLNYMLQQTPTVTKQILFNIQNAYPIRIKGMHIFNFPSYLETIVTMTMPLFNEKLKNRIMFYGKNEFNRLYKNVPLSVLPKQYGGEGGCLDEMAVEWKKKVEGYRELFLEDDQYFSDEAKRPGKPKTSSDVYGVEGSFRKLNVD